MNVLPILDSHCADLQRRADNAFSYLEFELVSIFVLAQPHGRAPMDARPHWDGQAAFEERLVQVGRAVAQIRPDLLAQSHKDVFTRLSEDVRRAPTLIAGLRRILTGQARLALGAPEESAILTRTVAEEVVLELETLGAGLNAFGFELCRRLMGQGAARRSFGDEAARLAHA